ncbi:MAG: HAD-IB family hydrolase [Chloroflexi bacterium]|nr:MAG: HAD-IB family hydrolase [Chloroflexota bacterium]
MMTLDELIAGVEAAPRGPRVGAFFDFDGTVISGYSAAAFQQDRLQRGQMSPLELGRSLLAGLDMKVRGAGVSSLMRIAARSWAGHAEDELEQLGERLFAKRIAGMVYPEVRALVQAHRRRGHTVVLATSATRFQAEPVARDLEVDHLLCTRLEVAGGILTGEVLEPVLWGEAKAQAVRELAARRGIDLRRSHGYANGDEDVAFLEVVGHPRPLNPDAGLAAHAKERGWPSTRFSSRGRPGVGSVLRTGAAIGALSGAAALGLGVGLVNGRRRDASNLAASLGGDLALAVAGVRLNVTGEERLWSHRPAVFIFNHQSSFDIPIIASLVRRDMTGVAKKEAARDDRANSANAREALKPVIDMLQDGISFAIAPEGTRSATPRLRQFKKGAFHIAMQAGVPIVPIVIRNAGDVMWRNSFFVRPGQVDVAVLPPVSTEGWTVGDLSERVARMERLFTETLESWPNGRPATTGGRRAPSAARAR